jgi:iron complex outermembrane receptor protein
MSEIFSPNSGVNPDGGLFEPNISDHDEVGLKADLFGGKLSAMANIYRRQERNRIIAHPDLALASLGWRAQIPGDKVVGSEIDIYLNPIPELQMSFAYTLMDVNNLGGLYTRGLPDKQFSTTGRYEFSTGKAKGLALGFGYRFLDEHVGDAANTFWIKSFGVFDAFASYRWSRYEFNLRADNLADKYYADAAVNRNVIVAGPPRFIVLRVSTRF